MRAPLVSLREEKMTKPEMAGAITWAPQGVERHAC